jgi:RNA polymerase sigma factor (sigma-70 family)
MLQTTTCILFCTSPFTSVDDLELTGGTMAELRRLTTSLPVTIEAVDERAIIAAAQTDLSAFAPLYAIYVRPVHAYCLRCLGDHDSASDATQETFARALRGLPRYRDDAFRPWLFTIAHNVIIDCHRIRGGRPPDAPLESALWSADPEPGPEERALTAESRRSVHACLSHLPPDQRVVVELRLADLTGKEIAYVLSRSLGSVKIAQHRAFRTLAVLLGVEQAVKGESDEER